MTKQYFPTVEEILSIILAELPAGVFAEDLADDPNENLRSYSSSELRAHAQLLADAYENLFDINRDKFITTATSQGLTKWEKGLFATAQDSSLTDEQRRQNLLAKLRSAGGINYPTIRNIVAGVLGSLDFDILPYSGSYGGAWILDESSLGLNTWLSKIDPLYGYLLDNALDYTSAGITQQMMIDMQEVAYTYEVRIYGNADASTLANLDSQLTQFEPARSTHIIRNNYVRPVI
jgi:hypothetical protein